jgi:hypothetical protein
MPDLCRNYGAVVQSEMGYIVRAFGTKLDRFCWFMRCRPGGHAALNTGIDDGRENHDENPGR